MYRVLLNNCFSLDVKRSVGFNFCTAFLCPAFALLEYSC